MTLLNKKSASRAGCAATSALILSACSVPFPVYSVSGQNIEAIRNSKANIHVGPFQGAQNSVVCRLQPISPEGNVTFAAYIRKAFADEVLIANPASKARTIEIGANLRNIDVNCGIFSAEWVIDLEVTVNNGPPIQVKTVRSFDGNYVGAVVANRAYQAFVPAVQQTVHDILTNPLVQASAK